MTRIWSEHGCLHVEDTYGQHLTVDAARVARVHGNRDGTASSLEFDHPEAPNSYIPAPPWQVEAELRRARCM